MSRPTSLSSVLGNDTDTFSSTPLYTRPEIPPFLFRRVSFIPATPFCLYLFCISCNLAANETNAPNRVFSCSTLSLYPRRSSPHCLVFESLCTSFLLLLIGVSGSSFKSGESEGRVSSRLQNFSRLLLSFSFRPKAAREKFGCRSRMVLY